MNRIHLKNFDDWLFDIVTNAEPQDVAKLVSFVNAHTINLANDNKLFKSCLCQSDVVLNDGAGLEIYAKLCHTSFFHNFNGTDLLPHVFAESVQRGVPLKVFLFGAAPGRVEMAKTHLEATYPGVSVVGIQHGFGFETTSVLNAIRISNPDVLLVALGNPKQELWLAEHKADIAAKVCFGVGALIDFLSQKIPRAPHWMRKLRLEWLYRLALEPKRMASRYLLGNPKFLISSLVYVYTRRKK